MLDENLLIGEPRKAIIFNTEVLMEGLKVNFNINTIILQIISSGTLAFVLKFITDPKWCLNFHK